MERMLGRFPDEHDLSENFTPGVRFFFRYEHITTHPYAIFDGVLPLKIKDEVKLVNWVHAIIIPTLYLSETERFIPESLKDKTHYLKYDCKDIWEWSAKVYEFAKSI